jgi:hypothetical protein
MPATCEVCQYETIGRDYTSGRVITVTTRDEVTQRREEESYLACQQCSRIIQEGGNDRWDRLVEERGANYWTVQELRAKHEKAIDVHREPYIDGRPPGRQGLGFELGG